MRANSVTSHEKSSQSLDLRAGSGQEFVAAVGKRWFAISDSVLDEFERIINQHPNHEPSLQAFLERFPQIVDPLVVQAWSQPNLHGKYFADLILRLADESYVIVELEAASKRMVTQTQLSADVTHAPQQGADYRNYLIRHGTPAQELFEGFTPDGCSVLAIVGLEGTLNDAQQRILAMFNRENHNKKVIGYDRLMRVARVIYANLARNEQVAVRKAILP